MSQKKDFRPIYKRVVSHCQPFSHGGPWQKLPVLGGICRSPADPTAVISDLQQQFSQADLVEAGVLVVDETIGVQLDLVLSDQHTIIIPLRRTPTEGPFDLLTDHGTLSGRRPPICASLRDGRVVKLIEATKGLLAALGYWW